MLHISAAVLVAVPNAWVCADEAPLCQITEGSVSAPFTCTCTRAKSMASNFCKADPGNPNSCGRYNEFNALDGQVRLPSSSLLSNCGSCYVGGGRKPPDSHQTVACML